MALLEAGVDVSVIALWLGHEGIEATNMYLSMQTSGSRSEHSARRHLPEPNQAATDPPTGFSPSWRPSIMPSYPAANPYPARRLVACSA